MKKFQIKIPTPCHENWDAMTQQDKGKFCGSCQKTVIDFSTMSDRQIADFFKKPLGSVCGRFHSDQLERPIAVPRKRIPWVKYFFNVTWPALVFFLKSCGQKQDVMGKAVVNVSAKKPPLEEMLTTVGMVLPEILPADSLPKPKQTPPEDACTNSKGEIAWQTEEPLMGDTIAVPIDTTESDSLPVRSYEPLDTVNIICYGTQRRESLIAGAISIVKTDIINSDPIQQKTIKNNSSIHAFPNPVRAGGRLTIQLAAQKDAPKQIDLLSVNGGLITKYAQFSKENNFDISIPAGITPGIYILRLITEKPKVNSVKILITN